MHIVGRTFVAAGVFDVGLLVVGVGAGMRTGRPAREAMIWEGLSEVEGWRWVPGPGL